MEKQMSSIIDPSQATSPGDESAIRRLYQHLLESWNQRDADKYASLFADTAQVIGFDGSQMLGRAAIGAELGKIFADHVTAAYVSIVRDVRFLTTDVAVLRAAVGMKPPGQSELNPHVNAVQTLTAVKRGGQWQVELFQNTPAQFHGRPDLAQQLTEELSQFL
jgi:uncharacterized protein (TIGR02246 family)